MLSQAHRRSIHSSLTPILGEEEADALLAELPTSAESQPATKADLAELRTEMHDLFRQMVMWVALAIIGAMLGGMGVAAGIGAAVAG